MDSATQLDWLNRTRRHLAEGSTDADAAVARVAVSRYSDPAFAAAEQAALFGGGLPLAAGYSDEIRQPGDFVAHEHLGLPLLLLRAEDGGVRAYLNVCRHRGARLVTQACGTGKQGTGKRGIVCPYHAWSYDLEGRLRGLPLEKQFGAIDKAEHSLVRLPADEAFGIVFVQPDRHARIDLASYLGALKADLEGFGLSNHVLYDRREIGVAANWKLLVEGGLETYHVRHAHARTIAPMFNDTVQVVDALGPHARLYFTKRAARELGQQDLSGLSVRDYGNPLYFCFPNLILLIQPDHATALIMHPKGLDKSLVLGGALVPEAPASDKARAHWDKNVRIFWDALDEDFQLAQSIQSGLRSGANGHVSFGRFEQACAWFNAEIDRRMA